MNNDDLSKAIEFYNDYLQPNHKNIAFSPKRKEMLQIILTAAGENKKNKLNFYLLALVIVELLALGVLSVLFLRP